MILASSGKKISTGCLRSHSNAGFSDADGIGNFVEFIELWLWFLTSSLARLTGMTLEEVFTLVMLIDAKYVHTSILQSRLDNPELRKGQWDKLGVLEKKGVGKLDPSRFNFGM